MREGSISSKFENRRNTVDLHGSPNEHLFSQDSFPNKPESSLISRQRHEEILLDVQNDQQRLLVMNKEIQKKLLEAKCVNEETQHVN